MATAKKSRKQKRVSSASGSTNNGVEFDNFVAGLPNMPFDVSQFTEMLKQAKESAREFDGVHAQRHAETIAVGKEIVEQLRMVREALTTETAFTKALGLASEALGTLSSRIVDFIEHQFHTVR